MGIIQAGDSRVTLGLLQNVHIFNSACDLGTISNGTTVPKRLPYLGMSTSKTIHYRRHIHNKYVAKIKAQSPVGIVAVIDYLPCTGTRRFNFL